MWKDNKIDSPGEFRHADGDVYIGEWSNEKANGQGKYVHAKDGTVYEGHWKDDVKDG